MKSLCRKSISLIVVLMLTAMIFNVPVLATDESTYSYSDIDGHWAAEIIEKWSSKGLLKGYEDGTFLPDAMITGDEMAFITDNLLKGQGKSIADMQGLPATIRATSTETVHREDAIVTLYKVLAIKPQEDAWTTFTDDTDISDYAVEAVKNMYENNLINGYADGTLKPLEDISRAEVLKIVDVANSLGYFTDLNDGIARDENIILIKNTTALGEMVVAVAIDYGTAIDGSNLKKTDLAVEAILGESATTRTITKIYTNDSAQVATEGKVGSYVIIELSADDANNGTLNYDTIFGRNQRYQLNYYITQTVDISAVNGTIFSAGEKKQSGKQINPLVESFETNTYTGANATNIDYRLFTPVTEEGKKYPLVVFLHGNGERGTDNWAPLAANIGGTVWATAENQAKNPTFVLAPQNPLVLSGKWLDQDVYEATMELIQSIADNPLIDTSRIYITGISQGGFGTWGFIQRNPDYFAGAMPICGGGDITNIEVIKDQPIWAFHAADDPVVPVTGELNYLPTLTLNGTRDMVEALLAKGSTLVKYTEYEEGYIAPPLAPMAHFSWVPAYNNQEAIDWMFQQVKE